MIVGVVVIEVVFVYPGLGALIVDAVLNRDVPVIQGAAMVFVAGAVLGFIAATMGGGVDQLLSLVVDVVISIPTLIASLIVLSAVETATPTLALVIRIIYAMPVFHITRAVAMDIEVMDYVEVARVRGEGLW